MGVLLGSLRENLGDSGGIRTHDPQIRNLVLYPAELRNHWNQVNPSKEKEQLVRFLERCNLREPFLKIVDIFHNNVSQIVHMVILNKSIEYNWLFSFIFLDR